MVWSIAVGETLAEITTDSRAEALDAYVHQSAASARHLRRGRVMRHLLAALIVVVMLGSLLTQSVGAQVSVTTLGVPYTQSFDTLPASGSATWTNNSTIPGWFHARTGTGTTIVANNGSSNAGNLYSYGTGTATDRALGSLGSGNAAIGNMFWGVRLQNNTGATITSLDVSYTGEQWRNAGQRHRRSRARISWGARLSPARSPSSKRPE